MKKLAVLFILWCAASFSAAAAGADYPVKVRISTFAFIVDGKTTIRGTPLVDRVIEEGWLERELSKRGVGLEWYPVVGDTGAVTNEALAAGRVDFANIGDLPSILLNAGGVRTAVVAPSGRGSDMYLLVPNNSPVKSIRELKGKRISVHRGRPWELGLRKLIESEGLKVSDFKLSTWTREPGLLPWQRARWTRISPTTALCWRKAGWEKSSGPPRASRCISNTALKSGASAILSAAIRN